MNQVQEMIQKIEEVGGSVHLKDGDRLLIEAPKGLLTSEIKDALVIYKQDIIRILKGMPPAHCLACQYHDTGPYPFGKEIIHWCGPWYEANGDQRWWNIAELTSCPKGKREDVFNSTLDIKKTQTI